MFDGTIENVEIENGKVVITIAMQDPRPSASGKTMVVATTSGNQVRRAYWCALGYWGTVVGLVWALIKP